MKSVIPLHSSPTATAASRQARSATGVTPGREVQAAHEALSLCLEVDGLAREALQAVSADEHDHFFELLKQRDEMMQDLAEQLAILTTERPTADGVLFAATERLVDDADELVSRVCAAVDLSQRLTMDLMVCVSRRVGEIRKELDLVQRSASASMSYSLSPGARLVDRRR